MFLNSMFSQMTTGIKGEGPFGDTPGTGVWRSMLTEQYSKSFAKSGGVGISNDVYPHADPAASGPRRLIQKGNRHEPASSAAAPAPAPHEPPRRRRPASSPKT